MPVSMAPGIQQRIAMAAPPVQSDQNIGRSGRPKLRKRSDHRMFGRAVRLIALTQYSRREVGPTAPGEHGVNGYVGLLVDRPGRRYPMQKTAPLHTFAAGSRRLFIEPGAERSRKPECCSDLRWAGVGGNWRLGVRGEHDSITSLRHVNS